MPCEKKKHYNSTGARKIYYKAKKIIEKAGDGPYAKWFCENPDCHRILRLDQLSIHHLLPRRMSPSLIYKASNMILLCEDCHNEIERHNIPKPKSPFKYHAKTFCRYCGFEIQFKRDRIEADSFHHKCLVKFINTEEFKIYMGELNDCN